MTGRPDPLVLAAPPAPDADVDTLRVRALAHVTRLADDSWTDHNAPDPGITLLELVAWGWGDLHYRAAGRGLSEWPLAGRPVSRLGAVADIARIARALAAPSSTTADAPPLAETLPASVRTATRTEAQDRVRAAARTAGVTLGEDAAAACVRLLRAPLLHEAALDLSARVSAAFEEAAAGLPSGAGDGARDSVTVRLLRDQPVFDHLWDDELQELVARRRRRETLQTVAGLADELRAAVTEAALVDLEQRLIDAGVPGGASETGPAELATALSRTPGDRPPERWETDGGTTRIWPPTPDQALRCEPVTADDYASRARAATGVRRAWAVRGAMPGMAWHGRPTVVTDRPGTVTLLVERAARRTGPGDRTDDTFALGVLDEVLGPQEAASPYAAEGTRRLLGDELGVATVRHHPVAVSAVLHAPLGVDRTALIERARGRIEAWFTQGRPEAAGAEAPSPGPPGRGPWPSMPQPDQGWTPGEPIRLTELVQVLAADPVLLGVTEVSATVKDGPMLHLPVQVRVTSPLTLAGLQVADGVALAAGERVLVAGQTDPSDNGVYDVAAGPWPRSEDLDCPDCLVDAVVAVLAGAHAGSHWRQASDAPLRVGTDPLLWEPAGRTVLADVRLVATTPVTPSGQRQLDDTWLFTGDRVLLTAQPDPAANGIHVVAAGAWTRAGDTTTGSRLPGAAVRIAEGRLAGSTWWLATPAPITVGTSAQTWLRTAAAQPAATATTGDIRIPAGGLPVLAGTDCLEVRYEATSEEDGDA